MTARDQEGSLIGIAPLFHSPNRDGVPALLFLGSVEISDYLDLIVRENQLPVFAAGLLEHLSNENVPDWQVLDLFNILEDSPSITAIQEAARSLGWSFNQEQLQHCPHVPLPGDWDEYLASIHKKQRHEIRRKMRRADEFGIPVDWYIVGNEHNLDSEIEDFLALMAQDPEKDQFLTDNMRSQMKAMMHAAFQAGWLQLSFLVAGEEKTAGYLNFDYADNIWVYNSGINFDYRELSPGWVLMGHLLKWSNENNRKYFDFMRGDERYKYRFGAVDRLVIRVTVTRRK